MQPHYFPWAGYFNLIFKSDKFIFLDDAQFSKGSWHNKNFIIINKQKYSFKVPILKSQLSTNINEKIIDQKKKWKSKQVKTIIQSYSKHKFIDELNILLDFFLNLNSNNLFKLNIEIIKFISNKLNISNDFLCSSEFKFKEKRTNKIIKILKKLNAKEYISPKGAEQYLKDDNFRELSEAKLVFNNFIAPEYDQKHQENFIKNLSIVDVIANLGWKNTEDYVKSNY